MISIPACPSGQIFSVHQVTLAIDLAGPLFIDAIEFSLPHLPLIIIFGSIKQHNFVASCTPRYAMQSADVRPF